MVQIYLDIEKVRFGDKLQYQVNIEKGLEDQRIPKFIIQPLVENAIKHGISKIVDHGLLKLDIYKTENQLHIRVSDNGADFPEDIMTGYGLQNIYEKLDILYPNRYEVLLQNGKDKNILVILK
jgi:LytS/YehU family sensor histidine kinase